MKYGLGSPLTNRGPSEHRLVKRVFKLSITALFRKRALAGSLLVVALSLGFAGLAPIDMLPNSHWATNGFEASAWALVGLAYSVILAIL